MPLSNPHFELSDRTRLDTRHGQLVLANIKNIDFPFISGSFYLVSNDSTFQSISLSRFCSNRSFFSMFHCAKSMSSPRTSWNMDGTFPLFYFIKGGALGRTLGAPRSFGPWPFMTLKSSHQNDQNLSNKGSKIDHALTITRKIFS